MSFLTKVWRQKDCKHEKNVLCIGHSCHHGFVKRLCQHPKQQRGHQHRQRPSTSCTRASQSSQRIWRECVSRRIIHENDFQHAACSRFDYLIDSLCQYHQYWRCNFAKRHWSQSSSSQHSCCQQHPRLRSSALARPVRKPKWIHTYVILPYWPPPQLWQHVPLLVAKKKPPLSPWIHSHKLRRKSNCLATSIRMSNWC